MKKLKSIILSLILVSIFSLCAEATVIPYENYTFSETDAEVIHSPQAYIPNGIVYGEEWECGALKEPTDFDVDSNGDVFILDNGNNRVVVLDGKLNFKKVFPLETTDENGNGITFNNAKGITVTEEKMYICDTDNKRILIYGKNGGFIRTVNAPESSLLGEDFIFQPTKVAVDNKGNLYVVSNGTYEGIINMKETGEFSNFFASNSVTASAWELFWRRFSSSKQRKTMEQLVPQDFSSIDLDNEGFFLITTYTEVDSAMVKRVNQGGVNIIRALSNVKITGDQNKVRSGTLAGNSSFCDISSGPDKIYACLDKTRGKVYCYNNDGYLLYTFGTLSSQYGGFLSPVAVSYLDDYRIAVLDKANCSLTVFKTTDYADAVNLGIKYQNELDYGAAYEQWGKVLEINGNYQIAQNMIGKACYNTGDYQKAMEYFKACGNTEMYSDAREAIRMNYIYEYSWAFLTLIAVIVLAVITNKIIKFYKRKNPSKR